jgi:hypothetical protein
MPSSNPADVTGGNYNRRVAIYQYPAELGSPEYPHFITFTNRRSYTTTVQTTGGGRNQARRGSPGQTVALYLPPDALKTTYSQGYGDVDMGAAIGYWMLLKKKQLKQPLQHLLVKLERSNKQ